jgi:nucleoside-diphosphate-sugar epimerase
MRVALTGATGFTGRFVSAALSGLVCHRSRLRLICNRQAVDQAIEVHDFDTLIHLAGMAFVNASDWQGFYDLNQIGTLHLLDAVARKKAGTRCILASSAQVYGPKAEGLITEAALAHPYNHYAVSKYAMELGASFLRDRIEIVVTRPF